MPDSKLQRILDAFADRLAVIRIADGYHTDIGKSVRRDRWEPGLDDMPCCLVVAGERLAETRKQDAARVAFNITVLAYVVREGTDSERQGIELLDDIQRAIETGDMTLGNLVRDTYGIAWQGDELFLPESGQNAVGARVIYTAPHVRKQGDPEIT